MFSAPDDIPQPERIRSLLKDLREVRQGKAREGIQHLNPIELNVGHIRKKHCIRDIC